MELTIEVLKEKHSLTDDQLDHEIGEQDMFNVAILFGGWSQYVETPGLGLSPGEKAQIMENPTLVTNRSKMKEALKIWRSPNPYAATFRKLLSILLSLKTQGVVAQAVCKYLTNSVESTQVNPNPIEPDGKQHVPSDRNGVLNEMGQEYRFCTGEYFQKEKEEELQSTLVGGGWGSVRQSKLWDVARYSTLKVHFLNPKVLEDKKKTWTYGTRHEQLTTNLILSWACTWNTPGQDYPKLPDHEETNPALAQIRVKFDTTQISESQVGQDALRVTDETKPTMILNLFEMSDAAKKSYVIHEFGHVLGLDHEHQRSRFWDVLAEKDQKGAYRFIVGIENMTKIGSYGQPACEQHLSKGWPEQEMDTTKPAYDPDSIMHYWFDKRWLLPKYQDLGTVRTATDLSEEQEKVLEGVHARDVRKYNNLLPVGQSSLDYQALKDAYQ